MWCFRMYSDVTYFDEQLSHKQPVFSGDVLLLAMSAVFPLNLARTSTTHSGWAGERAFAEDPWEVFKKCFIVGKSCVYLKRRICFSRR